MSKHKNNTDPQPKTTKEQLKRLSIATIAALGLISAVGAAIPNETVAGHAVRETERHTTPLGYYFGGQRNNNLSLYVEDAGQRIIDYAQAHPKNSFLAGVQKEETTGMLHVKDGKHTVVVAVDRHGDQYTLRAQDFWLHARDDSGKDHTAHASLGKQDNEKNDAGQTWDVEIYTWGATQDSAKHLENNLELARSRSVPLEQLEQADHVVTTEIDRILGEMGM